MADPAVLVVGDLAQDIVIRAAGALVPGSDVAAAISRSPGGAGANVAAGLAGLGIRVTLVGCVGPDDRGQLEAELSAAGVRCAVRVVHGARTGTVVAFVEPGGERSMASDRGANLELAIDDLPDDLLRRHTHVHLSGYPLLDERTRPAARYALTRSRELGRTTSVDPASSGPLLRRGVAAFRRDIVGVDLLTPNAPEARLLAGEEDVTRAADVLAGEHPVVAVTLGAEGALWRGSDGSFWCPAHPRDAPVLDSTGAGDAFTAGLLASWLSGSSGPACLQAGVRAAAKVLGRPGAR